MKLITIVPPGVLAKLLRAVPFYSVGDELPALRRVPDARHARLNRFPGATLVIEHGRIGKPPGHLVFRNAPRENAIGVEPHHTPVPRQSHRIIESHHLSKPASRILIEPIPMTTR